MQIHVTGNPEGFSLVYEYLRGNPEDKHRNLAVWASKNGFKVWWAKDDEKLNYSVRVVW